jgi:hypothetical protein
MIWLSIIAIVGIVICNVKMLTIDYNICHYTLTTFHNRCKLLLLHTIFQIHSRSISKYIIYEKHHQINSNRGSICRSCGFVFLPSPNMSYLYKVYKRSSCTSSRLIDELASTYKRAAISRFVD